MNITFIGCPFQTTYGTYIRDLGAALSAGGTNRVSWVGTKCGCGDAHERERHFIEGERRYFELPVIGDYRSSKLWKRRIRFAVKHVFDDMRAGRFESLSAPDSDVAHFQQTLAAFGSDVVFRWLRRRGTSRKVVTVHELDAQQVADPSTNRAYNLADAVLVHDRTLGLRLIQTGVDAHRVHHVCYGVRLPPEPPAPRSQRRHIVFYAGHRPMSGKGMDVVFAAFASLRRELGDAAPRLLVHGHYGLDTPAGGEQLASELGIADAVTWCNEVPQGEMQALYAQALLCVLPYTGSFAGLPCALAAANGVPVIGTDVAGMPEHLGTRYERVPAGDSDELFRRMRGLLEDEQAWNSMSSSLFLHAEHALGWGVIAERTQAVYEGRVASDFAAPH